MTTLAEFKAGKLLTHKGCAGDTIHVRIAPSNGVLSFHFLAKGEFHYVPVCDDESVVRYYDLATAA